MYRRLIPLLLVAACSSPSSAIPDTTSPSTTTTTAAPTTTISSSTTSSTVDSSTTTTTLDQPVEEILYEHWKGSFQYRDGLQIDVHAPENRSNHPIAITIHGGGWYTGRLDSMGYLADGLAERGFVVFNAAYRTIAQGGSFPGTVEDVACAVAYAQEHALDYSTTATHFTLIGYSAGAHLSSLVAFAPDAFECDGPTGGVDAWVGLSGSYNTDLYAFLLQPFFGTALAEDPAPWEAGNPYTYVDGIRPDLELLFVHGDADELVPLSMTEDLFFAADQAGAAARLQVVRGAGHGEVTSPRVVGDMIAEFVAGDQ